MHPPSRAEKFRRGPSRARVTVWLVALATLSVAAGVTARSASQTQTQRGPRVGPRGYTISVDVNLVMLYASVRDKAGRRIKELVKENFKVYEDNVEQKTAVFSSSDIPVTLGIVIDDSGSMRDKRPAVAAAALAFVQTSNPQDQVFVVNFNDVFYLDTPGDFARNIEDLKAALDKIDSRGGTALYDAGRASLDHLKLGSHDKKVLLVISDGEDNASRISYDEFFRIAQESDAVIYTIGLLGVEEGSNLFKLKGRGNRRAAKVLRKISQATGGAAYFPKSLDEVKSICVQVAEDIRNQYTIGYYPANTKKDGSFRQIRVEARKEGRGGRLVVRARTGYYAPRATVRTSARGGG
jgi:Ca-activated chloride channel family protein